MGSIKRILDYIRKIRHKNNSVMGEPQMIANGWNQYAKMWKNAQFAILPGYQVRYLGDEWTVEDVKPTGTTTYGLDLEIINNFEDYINSNLFDLYLPNDAEDGMEIGPGGGRITKILIPRTHVLHLVDASEAMLQHLRQRFKHVSTLRYYQTDGMTLPMIPDAKLDYIVAFDVFVHFEPRLIYWYLHQITTLLKPGGIGIIHYSNIMTPIGWQQFEMDLELNLEARKNFAAFGIMCPSIMTKFIENLGLEIISEDLELIPRDAVTVFRKPKDFAG